MRKLSSVLVAAALLAAPAMAQHVTSYGLELRPVAGAYVPLGNQRDDFKDATMVGLQGAFEVSQYFHVLASVGWAAGQNKFGFTKDQTDIYSYDVGAEGNLQYELSEFWLFKPFVGLGGGGRTYDYAASVDMRTCTAGYGSGGLEFQRNVMAVRFEGRGYASCLESPVTGTKKTRADATFAVGFAYHFR
jgi:hypothetical protein